jgi:multidrug efflux pump subunit AcrA (membrane-fusion protein)
VGKTLRVRLGNKTLTFGVNRVLPSAQNDLKVVEAVVPPLPLPSESTLSVELETKTCRGFIVPFNALLYLDGGVFAVKSDKTPVPVKVEAVYGGKACVQSEGLREGDAVLVAGQYRLREIALHKYPIKVVEQN